MGGSRGLVCAVDSDATNVYITLMARSHEAGSSNAERTIADVMGATPAVGPPRGVATRAARAGCYCPRIFFFWFWNSASVRTPLSRRSARRWSSVVTDGADGEDPPPEPPWYMRFLFASPCW